ncbi:MAG: VWA domain-containing protein [Chthoniobacteraceae bacterium]
MRRLPVYLLLDCSESMIGDGLNAVQAGVETMFRALRTDPHALETVWLSCITFDREARLLFPLTELTDVQTPKLRVRPGTAIGAALNLCADRIQSEVQRTTTEQKGDWRPLIILLTDGQPTDDWTSALKRLGSNVKPRPANIYAIGCGQDVDTASLRQLTDIVLHLPEMTEERIKKLFVWLTASVTEGSRGIHEPNDGAGINLDKLPETIVKVDQNYQHQCSDTPRQVFLFGQCSKQRKPYLMRYRFEEQFGVYLPVASHVMEMEGGGGRESFALPKISSEQLDGCPPCPYCHAPGAGACGTCGTIFCSDPQGFEDVVCPGCQTTLKRRGPNEQQGSFQVRQSLS